MQAIGCAYEDGNVWVGQDPPSKRTPAPPANQMNPAQMNQLMVDSAAMDALATRFIALAASGDWQGMQAILSPNEIANTGLGEVSRFSRETIIPFFQANKPTRFHVNVSATDSYGSHGFAYYGFAGAGRQEKPFVVYVVREKGKLVVASPSVNQFVKGRHDVK